MPQSAPQHIPLHLVRPQYLASIHLATLYSPVPADNPKPTTPLSPITMTITSSVLSQYTCHCINNIKTKVNPDPDLDPIF